MLRNKIYYRIKPFVPPPVRMAVRKRLASWTRARTGDRWPIMPGSEIPPAGWPGWPEGKKVAFVLTHDVESAAGLQQCRRLMELEMEMGFRSAFNFIPEGGYRVPHEFREELCGNGFEVGVHDFRHDGHLFASRREFSRNASHINHYINEWGASGFRSGFMLHNLDWLHDLEIKYDASTFDTDPFEPQPEGRHTIFPFWVQRQGKAAHGKSGSPDGGYVELPYTLPQDSTLFLLLNETNIDVWLRKLDWIAEHGGMALINVHPDYMSFGDRGKSRRKYPYEHYVRFLEHLRERHANQYWSALPRDVASYVAGLAKRPVLARSRRICMVTYSFYTSDNRVMRYAEALATRGDQVDVFALRRNAKLPNEEMVQGVRLFRIQDRFSKAEQSQLGYLWPLLRFFATASWRITKRHAKHRYDLLHIHNIPDFLVFSAWYPRLTGAHVILDVHDIVPEFFASKFGTNRRGLKFHLLKRMEKASARFADHVIIANHLWWVNYAARTGTVGRCTPFINNVDKRVFAYRPRTRNDDKQIILFPGGLQWHQGVDIALRAFARLRQKMPKAEFHIYGDGSAKPSLIELSEELGLNGSVKFFNIATVREIAKIMSEADLGVVPKRADSFGNEAYSTKIMEFMSVGVPVVVSSTKIDRFYFDDTIVRFFESGNDNELADAMFEVLTDRQKRESMIKSALDYAERNSWANYKNEYLKLVDSLCMNGSGDVSSTPAAPSLKETTGD